MSIGGSWDRIGDYPRGWAHSAKSASGIVFVALAWEFGPRLGAVNPEFLPPLSAVLATIVTMALDGSLFLHTALSSVRALIGLTLAAVIAVPLGLLLGAFRPRAYVAMGPSLRLLSHINPFAMMPVFLLFFGGGEVVKVVVVAWVALWPILFYSVTAAVNADRDLLRVGRSFGLSTGALFRRVLFPAAFPTVFVGLRIAGCLVFFILIAAEMLGASGGLGWLVHNSAMNYQVRGIYAAALLVVLLGYGLDQGLRRLEWYMVPHARGVRRAAEQTTHRRASGGRAGGSLLHLPAEASG